MPIQFCFDSHTRIHPHIRGTKTWTPSHTDAAQHLPQCMNRSTCAIVRILENFQKRYNMCVRTVYLHTSQALTQTSMHVCVRAQCAHNRMSSSSTLLNRTLSRWPFHSFPCITTEIHFLSWAQLFLTRRHFNIYTLLCISNEPENILFFIYKSQCYWRL